MAAKKPPKERLRGVFRPKPPGSQNDEAIQWLAGAWARSKRRDVSPGDLLLRDRFVRPPTWDEPSSPSTPLSVLASTDRPALPMLLLSLWLAQQSVRSGTPKPVPPFHPWDRRGVDGERLPSWSELIWGENVLALTDDRERTHARQARRDAVRLAWNFMVLKGFVEREGRGFRLLCEDRTDFVTRGIGARYRLPVPLGTEPNKVAEPCIAVPRRFVTDGWLRVLPAAAIHIYFVLLANLDRETGTTCLVPGRGGPQRSQYESGITALYEWYFLDPDDADLDRFARGGRISARDRASGVPFRSIRYRLNTLTRPPWELSSARRIRPGVKRKRMQR